MGKRATALVLEAARRWLIGDSVEHEKGLRYAWTGLGSATNYKPATDKGLMEHATGPHPGFSTWWRLTDKGVTIVEAWLDAGLTLEHFYLNWTSVYALVEQSGVSLSTEGLQIVGGEKV